MNEKKTSSTDAPVETAQQGSPADGTSPVQFNDRFSTALSELKASSEQGKLAVAPRNGKLIFTVDDLRNARDPLAKLLRLMFIVDGITDEEFKERYRRYGNCQQWDRPNFESAIKHKNGHLRWNRVQTWLAVCGRTLLDVSLTYQEADGTVRTVRTSDADQMLRDLDARQTTHLLDTLIDDDESDESTDD